MQYIYHPNRWSVCTPSYGPFNVFFTTGKPVLSQLILLRIIQVIIDILTDQ